MHSNTNLRQSQVSLVWGEARSGARVGPEVRAELQGEGLVDRLEAERSDGRLEARAEDLVLPVVHHKHAALREEGGEERGLDHLGAAVEQRQLVPPPHRGRHLGVHVIRPVEDVERLEAHVGGQPGAQDARPAAVAHVVGVQLAAADGHGGAEEHRHKPAPRAHLRGVAQVGAGGEEEVEEGEVGAREAEDAQPHRVARHAQEVVGLAALEGGVLAERGHARPGLVAPRVEGAVHPRLVCAGEGRVALDPAGRRVGGQLLPRQHLHLRHARGHRLEVFAVVGGGGERED
mmetsp:Transcript_42174/g.112794  ORF Transcript_42174/g.112794 Transcript_42174/m.112794 type:complete len:289 (+) Transcript_42174:789-1655(+)